MNTMAHNINIESKVLSLLPDDLEGKRILDVGIGHGLWALILRSWKRGNPYIVGVDPCEVYTRNARHVGLYDELYCQTGQQYLVDNPGETFDIILICEVLGYLKTKKDAFSLLTGLESRLQPGGVLILSVPDGKSNSSPHVFKCGDFTAQGYQVERIIKEGFSLGHIVGPIAKTWWTLRWGQPPATHTTVAWRHL